ncbi:MAG TPA: hypothetical protein VFJ51_14885 [Nitrososphaeraceae archaeon]|nr:hypothetical protein [Nitrososphaeraceae archaeon]
MAFQMQRQRVISLYDKNDFRALSSKDISANFLFYNISKRALLLPHSSNNRFRASLAANRIKSCPVDDQIERQ